MLKAAAKSALKTAACVVGPHRWRRGPCLLVLTYHRVLPLNHPDRASEQPGMLVTPELLSMHFETLQRHFTPVHLDDWLRAARAGEPPPGRSLAITFDDGWRDNYYHAFPVIKAAAIPVTLFLVTDMVGSRYQFWPNRLARVLKAWHPRHAQHLDESTRRHLVALDVPLDMTGSESTPEVIDSVIGRCKVASDAHLHALLDQVEALLPDLARAESTAERDLLDWAEVQEMADSGLVRFGSHTRRHTRLRDDLSDEQLEDEIGGSRRILEDKLGQPAPLFCYPNGDCSPRAYERVKSAYEGAVSTRRGWHRPRYDSFFIQRIGVHGDISDTPGNLLARCSGWPRV